MEEAYADRESNDEQREECEKSRRSIDVADAPSVGHGAEVTARFSRVQLKECHALAVADRRWFVRGRVHDVAALCRRIPESALDARIPCVRCGEHGPARGGVTV